MPLYTIFKDLAFHSLCLVPNNIDFVLSCLKCILNLLSTNQSHKLKKSLIRCFSIYVCFYIGKLYKYHQYKVMSHCEASNLLSFISHLCLRQVIYVK